MKKIQNILVSTRTMAVLLLVYALSMAYATFMENDYGTPTAKAFIYESKWFEAIMFLLIINFIGNIGRYRLWKREKWPLLAFHLSFILLFIGGAITRYISYEGTMHIREGETSNEIVTSKNFFKIQIEEKGEVLNYADIPFLMTPEVPFWSKVTNHYFKATYDFNGKKIKVKQLAYTPRKKDSIKVTPNGKEYLHFVTTDDAGRLEYYLSEGEVKNIGGTLVTYNRPIDGAVEFKKQDGKLYIKTPVDATYMVMASQEVGASPKDEYTPLSLRSLYTINQMRIVVPEGLKRGEIVSYSGDKKKDKNIPDELLLEVEGPKTKQQVSLQVQEGNPNLVKQISLDGMNMMLGFGAKVYTTPFALKLDDFVMETYPGSSSPSAYESHVQIIDNGKQTPYKIYMNNVLNYRGYRFFQSSFDPDRHGTVLSVNHDYWGTLITYIGYTLMFIAMFITLFWRGTRFWSLNKMLKDISKKKALGVLLLMLSFGLLQAQPKTSAEKAPAQKVLSADDMVQHINIDKAHAEKFGSLLVQSYDGRIQPVNTQALDILRKLTGKESFKQLDANQWFLSATIDPMFWAQVHIIKVETRGKVGEELKKKTKANDEGYTSLVNLFPADKFGNLRFVLEDDYNEAFNKKPAEQSKYDQAVIKLNDKVQVMNALMSWQYFRVIPVQNDPNHKWNSVMDANFQIDTNAQEVLGPYLSSVLMATQSDKWATADKELDKVKSYQAKWGKNVMPPQTKIDLEILMNKLDLNFKLMIFYSVVAALLLVLGFIELFKPNRWLHKVIKVILAAGILGYLVHLVGLGIRWYISGHAPWSNGYEAIMFISWVGISAGLLLYRNNNALIPSAGFLVAVLLMGFAHGAVSLDPQITPLVPVLKSYWLVIHVAIITSSYGFFALSFIIGIMVLLFYIVSSKATFQEHNDTTIKELTAVSEMSLTIGLFALTIGTFLGGVWANESWGRYWSWDPKETWAFISVMVYAFVLHMRLVPGLRGRYAFHMVTMFAFSSVIMTYFGVNYYLSGLHSYAAGDPIPVPAWVYITGASMITISLAAWFKYKKLNSKN
ncbi:c-type cytochrome biogenesis protein CcsB [Riemerella anatipestifer]|uniref:ABC-type transport system involved in cytochrome c biogenesis, permease component n=1 Tax=Riemerella anatipestifer RA-CH-1 TaxID=1228997 RepID=J9RA04_RIEAN|nr:c-type cytochrome biogenesis protein CcsB [Riemerella anatipestifer]AFR36207.1 ABC-type transport system involved in cytochrome c biogenesis, permease component [Riemerella anatipestifer RA-CH-1]AIH03210.1 cytochrome c-type biogenesis protein ccsb [Riemerella anatipestifer CH3]MCO7332019.1 c-type cytochrome biogenesis protein CcsB [Riemerella anatipestifer]MCO7350906.1 c-type cytochrome biogenesis protein CcsB [Riemerella anatipestifer]MCU7582355.1 c-type cytochrome biogenesis protein CcsB 